VDNTGGSKSEERPDGQIGNATPPHQDTMQVCLSGHKITGHYEENPESRRERCANCGEPFPWSKAEEKEFLAKDYGTADISKLLIDDDLKNIIQDRLDEAELCLRARAPLSAVIACGSAVEGMLYAYACNNMKLYNQAKAAPKDKNGKVRPFDDWTLEDLINVAKEVSHIDEGAKKFAQPLRDFRNYVHPRQQLKEAFNPDLAMAEVCYQVAKLIISNLEQS
jgi:hypothetical protein